MNKQMHQFARLLWCMAQGIFVHCSKRCKDRQPQVYYGGALSGFGGGPQVKVGLLQSRFPEHRINYNLVYLLSGALYLGRPCLTVLKRRQIPIVMNQNGVYFPAWYPKRWEAQNARLAVAMEAADHVFYQSAFCQRAADKFVGVRPKSSEVLYNAVDTGFFTPAKIRQPLAGRPVKFLLTGKVGLSTLSRLTSTIEGVARCRRDGIESVLDVYGLFDASVMEYATRLIDALKVKDFVAFRGAYPRDLAPTVYQNADIYVMNKHNDACPNTVLEALSCGLPVLYSASGGVPELVGDMAGAGLPIEESFEREITPSPEQFVEGAARILANHEAMAIQARKRAETMFGIVHWLERHQTVFNSLLEVKS